MNKSNPMYRIRSQYKSKIIENEHPYKLMCPNCYSIYEPDDDYKCCRYYNLVPIDKLMVDAVIQFAHQSNGFNYKTLNSCQGSIDFEFDGDCNMSYSITTPYLNMLARFKDDLKRMVNIVRDINNLSITFYKMKKGDDRNKDDFYAKYNVTLEPSNSLFNEIADYYNKNIDNVSNNDRIKKNMTKMFEKIRKEYISKVLLIGEILND